MNQKHIVNIGLPRCGTSWLWENICLHPAANNPTYEKENLIFFDSQNFHDYKKYYQNYEISFNLQTNLWMLDRSLIEFFHTVTTHISIIVRNPYDFIERYFDWIKPNSFHDEYVDWIIDMQIVNYEKILSRWMTTAPTTTNFKVFYFDDLKKNPELFFIDYLDFCGLETVFHKKEINKIVNENPNPIKTKIDFSKKHTPIINGWIDSFGEYVQQDMSKWKL